MMNTDTPDVGVVMGSRSDWETMAAAADILRQFGVKFECRVVSAHRTPMWMAEYATTAESRGLKVIIAGAGGAAHLPGMIAAQTILPVLGVPVQSKALNGLDSLLSIVQMPGECRLGPWQSGFPGREMPDCLRSEYWHWGIRLSIRSCITSRSSKRTRSCRTASCTYPMLKRVDHACTLN